MKSIGLALIIVVGVIGVFAAFFASNPARSRELAKGRELARIQVDMGIIIKVEFVPSGSFFGNIESTIITFKDKSIKIYFRHYKGRIPIGIPVKIYFSFSERLGSKILRIEKQ